MKNITIILVCVIALLWSLEVAESETASMVKCVMALFITIASGSTLLIRFSK
jgi:hypothetical protein